MSDYNIAPNLQLAFKELDGRERGGLMRLGVTGVQHHYIKASAQLIYYSLTNQQCVA